MREKSQQEQAAASRQVDLLINALNGAVNNSGYWLNTSGRTAPRFYPQGPGISPFNSLMMGLHTTQCGYETAQYTTFTDTKKRGESILHNEKGVPFNWYRWDKYVNRHDTRDSISREEYLSLPPERKALYKGERQREIRTLFNIDQTTFPMVDKTSYQNVVSRFGSLNDRGNLKAEERELRSSVKQFADRMKDNLVPIRKDSAGLPHYDTVKDAIYIPDQKHFAHYNEYVQELLRLVTSATGHQQRLAREGMVMYGGRSPSQSSEKYEKLITELASGVKMMEYGLPAKLKPESIPLVEYWTRELQETPCLIDAIESDINNALTVMKKAEQGEKIEYASLRTSRQTEGLRMQQRPQVSSEEALILSDILRHGGMKIDGRNFPGRGDKQDFLDKFSLGYYESQKQHSLEQVHCDDPEVVEVAYTEALQSAASIHRICEEYMPVDWEAKGSYTISDMLKEYPDRKSKELVMVKDNTTGIVDIVLPAGALAGGHVVMPNGDKHLYMITPDEVFSAEERKERQAKVISSNIPGFSKDRIEAALRREGASYVRFYNRDGRLGYRPDDSYFAGKRVSVAKLNGISLEIINELDVSEAVRESTEVQFDRVQMLRDDNNRWALYLKPVNEDGFAIYPEKEDINRFFSTIKQGEETRSSAVRMELAQKYYALAKNEPELKTDIFNPSPKELDTSRIERVNVFKTKDGRFMCLPVIAGAGKLEPREVSRLQWQRLWITDDVGAYKTSLAASLFADVLAKELKQNDRLPLDECVNDIAEVNLDMDKYKEMRGKFPDAILLFRNEGEYECFFDDAEKVSRIAGYELKKGKDNASGQEVSHISFQSEELDTVLPKLVRAEERVSIYDLPLRDENEAVAEKNREYHGLKI